MLVYQTVCYYGLKRVKVRDFEESYNGFSVDISNPVVLYHDN